MGSRIAASIRNVDLSVLLPFHLGLIRERARASAPPLLLLLALVISPVFAHGQGGSVSMQIIQPGPPAGTGGPAPFATVRVCPYPSGSGTPCSPLSNLFSDPGLTQSVSNPATSDQYGNVSLWVSPGPVIVQVTPVNGIVYSYLQEAVAGTLTTVGLSMPGIFNVTSSPLTGTGGTLNVSFAPESANLVLGTCGNNIISFCPLVAAQIPSTLNSTTISGNFTVNGVSASGDFNNILYVGTGTTQWGTGDIGSQIANAMASTSCASGCTVAVIPGAYALATSVTTPLNVALQFDGPSCLTTTGYSFTVNGPMIAPPVQIFCGTGTVTLGTGVPRAPVEWFGAVGDWNGSTGTDNTVAIQACFNAITNGNCTLLGKSYKISSALTINKSNVGLTGVTRGLPSPGLYPTPSPSTIVTSSASADIIDLIGASNSDTVAFNTFKDFTLARTAAPGVLARGLSMIYADGTVVDGVTSEDSTGCFYINGMASQGIGRIENSVAMWGYNGVAETSGSLGGFIVDSTNGATNNSIRIRNVGIFSALPYSSSYTTYGLELAGSQTHDLHSLHVETAEVDYAIWVFSSNLGFVSSADIWINDPINDGCYITCIYVNNIGGSLSVIGGWSFMSNGSGLNKPVIDIENSSHVAIIGQTLYAGAGTQAGVYINGTSGSNRVIGNDFTTMSNPAISVNLGTANIISGNIANSITATSIFSFTGSVGNVISDNTLNGTATNGIYLDAGSTNNSGLETNNIGLGELGTVTNPITDLGGNSTNFHGESVVNVGSIGVVGSGPSSIQFTPVSYGTLTATYPCNSTNNGRFAAVSDSTTVVYNAVVSGTGTNNIPVYCNGVNWVAH